MEDKYCVYKHTAPNRKVYIGITRQRPEKRWVNGKGYLSNNYFTNAIKKYGWDKFKHEVLIDGIKRKAQNCLWLYLEIRITR